jgi:hypothetical protein
LGVHGFRAEVPSLKFVAFGEDFGLRWLLASPAWTALPQLFSQLRLNLARLSAFDILISSHCVDLFISGLPTPTRLWKNHKSNGRKGSVFFHYSGKIAK